MAEESVVYVKVMTDEQMEVLRHQISVYATICDQLVELHKSITAHQDSISGMRVGNIHIDPLMISGSHKMSARQRWTPTPPQLQILENIFDQGHGTPNKEKIKEITVELNQHGPISETNVYNWFQNRRARSKRKHQVSAPNSNNAESEVETEVEYLQEEKGKTKSLSPTENLASSSDDLCFHNQEIRSEFHSLESQTDAGMDHQFMGRQDFQGNFDPFRDGFDMIG